MQTFLRVHTLFTPSPFAKLLICHKQTDQIEGFIGLTDDYIAGIFVIDKAQSRGIGKQLLDHVKAIKANLRLDVYQKNVRAVCFYQREGFVVQSENTDSDTNEKEYVMIWSR